MMFVPLHILGTPDSDRSDNNLEAAAGIEPASKGFADLRLSTWLRRLWREINMDCRW